MSVEITKTNVAIELSAQELDVVAGGVDLSLQSTALKENITAGHQFTASGENGSVATSDFLAIRKNTTANNALILGAGH